jgi:hypothetical protein
MAYSDFPGDPVHRFFQIWQQVGDCNKKDLFVWVAETAGIGNHNDGFGATPDDTFQGGLAMGFFNMNTGDAPFFKKWPISTPSATITTSRSWAVPAPISWR